MNILRLLSLAVSEIPRLVPLMRDARVPLWSKLTAVVLALLIVSPLNVLGDIPMLGFIDDGALLLFLLHRFVAFAERSAV